MRQISTRAIQCNITLYIIMGTNITYREGIGELTMTFIIKNRVMYRVQILLLSHFKLGTKYMYVKHVKIQVYRKYMSVICLMRGLSLVKKSFEIIWKKKNKTTIKQFWKFVRLYFVSNTCISSIQKFQRISKQKRCRQTLFILQILITKQIKH